MSIQFNMKSINTWPLSSASATHGDHPPVWLPRSWEAYWRVCCSRTWSNVSRTSRVKVAPTSKNAAHRQGSGWSTCTEVESGPLRMLRVIRGRTVGTIWNTHKQYMNRMLNWTVRKVVRSTPSSRSPDWVGFMFRQSPPLINVMPCALILLS
ncbi:uncharacterized protein EI90DRAFT_643258 [Cantharellus anzutake]|uniref:uncharacterized protein n=1 Tax=Cantharellus anzutake TaxID=1750568 RepID=UPI0019085AD1|nr:uncharacterized protein EI90DRAFT_643258 [Cantharellus anzutake]KAF8333237.1 hypothetical protein EI90DRAFT_643258 [Cantharellus anzutake]